MLISFSYPWMPLASSLALTQMIIDIHVWLYDPSNHPTPTLTAPLTISRRYGQSATRRTNRLPAIGEIPTSFIFFEKTDQPDTYDVWLEIDKAIVAAHFYPWQQARSNQYGRGRLWMILPVPVPRVITRV